MGHTRRKKIHPPNFFLIKSQNYCGTETVSNLYLRWTIPHYNNNLAEPNMKALYSLDNRHAIHTDCHQINQEQNKFNIWEGLNFGITGEWGRKKHNNTLILGSNSSIS